MRNPERWLPTKFIATKRGLRASRDPGEVGAFSRFVADIQAQWYERALRAHACGKLMDLGCGEVPLYGVYRDLVKEVVCVDWPNSVHPQTHTDIQADISERIPCDDECVDTVLLTDVLEHVAEPLTTMREAARVLRCHGKVIIGVPFYYWIHEEPHDYCRYTEFALRRLCQSSGLEVVYLDAYGGIPEVLLDLTAKTIGYLPRPLRVVFRAIHPAVALLSRASFAQSLSVRTKRVFPLGYLVVAQKQSIEGKAEAA